MCLPQEEKRKMKEEIERRRAEAAEKRQKVEDNMDGEDRPFKCVSPRGSSLKVSTRPPPDVCQSTFIYQVTARLAMCFVFICI